MDSFHSNQLLAPPLCDVTVPVKTQMQMCSVQSTVCIWLQPVKIEPNSVVSAQMEMTVLKSSLITADPPIKTQLHTPIYSYNTTALIGLLGYRSRFYKGLFTFSQVYLHLVLSWFFLFYYFFKQMENSEGRLSYWHNIGNGSTAALNNSHYSTIRTFSLGLGGK